ncbi:anti-sigma factor [Aquipluma nitroreducens]|uniref:Anti-sigma factor n=1 Tax=Aquipluma nitroreducens TaxID=2010828 RepID=A0A5K7S3F5_9BACT|nr:FecR family protein [Aquipluma nitroreducens]BBE16073.1 anti-sigma factor [Aquipluma nitroreducens]
MRDIPLIIARILLKVANKDEVDTISWWEKKSPLNVSFLNNLEAFWELSVEERSSDRLNIARERLLTRVKSTEADGHGRSLIYYLLRVAAVLVFVISIGGLSIYIASETNLFYKNNWVEVSTEAGQRSKVSLPDGSLVWLNAGSIIKYCPDKNERKVSLNGEAYFEVNHSPDYPFVIETGDTKIKVLGTKFNVSHYSGSKITEASLLSGKIEMTLFKSDKVIDIRPGEKVSYDAETQTLNKTEAIVQNDILWKQGILVFENESFNDLILKLERYYAVNFDYNRATFENIHYTGTINNLNIYRVLEFINLTIPINYEINNKTIKLTLNK